MKEPRSVSGYLADDGTFFAEFDACTHYNAILLLREKIAENRFVKELSENELSFVTTQMFSFLRTHRKAVITFCETAEQQPELFRESTLMSHGVVAEGIVSDARERSTETRTRPEDSTVDEHGL